MEDLKWQEQRKTELTLEQEALEKQKEDRERELEKECKKRETDSEEQLDKIKEQLEEMESCLQTISFDEHTFMGQKLLHQIKEPYSFQALQGQVQILQQRIKEGIEVLEEEKKSREKLEEQQIKEDKLRQAKRDVEKVKEQLTQMSEQVKSEWIEKFYQWLRNNQELSISEDLEQKLVTYMNQFTDESDFSEVKERIREQMEEIESELRGSLTQINNEVKIAESALEESELKLQEWENKKGPEPERDEAIEQNRRWLKEQGIPYEPFYKVIDFTETVSLEQKNRLEEVLFHMGVLDAVVIPENFKEKVMEHRQGMRDTYLFSGSNRIPRNLSELLEGFHGTGRHCVLPAAGIDSFRNWNNRRE